MYHEHYRGAAPSWFAGLRYAFAPDAGVGSTAGRGCPIMSAKGQKAKFHGEQRTSALAPTH